MHSISLSELTQGIQEAISINFGEAVWIRAEISELHENANGHCYLELIERNPETDALLAKSKAACWASTYRMLKPYFESSTGQTLRAGLTVLIAVNVEFHSVYGFNLNIKDIDPTFTVGEIALRRLKIMQQLEADGIAEMNKELEWASFPQRIAIISSKTAAGYDDFCNQLFNNSQQFQFYTKLFPAVMQGEKTELSVIAALEKIYQYSDLFDLVVIIRGGGAAADLSSFDTYELALNCAQFPLPIVTGIGHQRDQTVLDMVASLSLKTPTAVAEYLISYLKNKEDALLYSYKQIKDLANTRINSEKQQLNYMHELLKQNVRRFSMYRKQQLEQFKIRLASTYKLLSHQEKNKLDILEKNIETFSPAFLLKHAYSITTLNGKKLSSIKEIKQGDKIKTYLIDGSFKSTVVDCGSKRNNKS